MSVPFSIFINFFFSSRQNKTRKKNFIITIIIIIIVVVDFLSSSNHNLESGSLSRKSVRLMCSLVEDQKEKKRVQIVSEEQDPQFLIYKEWLLTLQKAT